MPDTLRTTGSKIVPRTQRKASLGSAVGMYSCRRSAVCGTILLPVVRKVSGTVLRKVSGTVLRSLPGPPPSCYRAAEDPLLSFRFLHLADLHLESNFGGRRGETRERLRKATHEAFERAVEHAIANDLHAVLAAGDLFDEPILSPRTELFLLRQVRRLADAGCWFLACAGNHDPGGERGRMASLGLEGAERIHLFRSPTPETVEVTDRDGNPVGIVVGAGHGSAAEAENLAATFPEPSTSLPLVGLLHTQVESAQRAAEHERYAPSTPADFRRSGYSYWALGHVHVRQQAVELLPVYYAGNLQGRHLKETGPKGGLVVDARAGSFAEPSFVRFAPVRWERAVVDDLEGFETLEGLAGHLAETVVELQGGEPDELIAHLDLRGSTPLASTLRDEGEREELEEELREATGALEVRLDAVGVGAPVDREALRESRTVVARAMGLLDRAEEDEALLDELAPELLAADESWSQLSPEDRRQARMTYLRELLDGLEQDLLDHALQDGDVDA